MNDVPALQKRKAALLDIAEEMLAIQTNAPGSALWSIKTDMYAALRAIAGKGGK